MSTSHDRERKKSELLESLPAVQLQPHSPRVERQFSSNISLVPHQQAMLQRALEIERIPPLNEDYGRIGFMTSKPSSGKTFVTLAMIAVSKLNGDVGPTPVNLIVVPPAILTQWKEAIDEYNNGSNMLQARVFTEYQDISALYFKKKVIRNYDILVTTSMYYKVIVDIARDIGLRLHRMIVDEIDGAEWSISGKADAEMTWYISATFADACTSRGYIGQLMNNVPVVRLQERICMCHDDFVDASFALPEPVHSKIKCLNRHLDYLLTQFLRNNETTLKALNGGHYSAVKNKYHPVFARNEQQVVDIIMFNASETVKRTQLHLDDIRKDPDLSPDEIMKLEKMISEAKLVEKEIRGVIQDSNLCLLCYNFISGQQASTPCCCHTFCADCVKNYMKTYEDCPACKARISLTDLWVEPSPYGELDVGGLQTKISAVTDIVKSTDGNKVLIFSEFADCFDDLQSVLSNFGQILVMDSGTVEEINKTIKKYRSLDKAVLLVCSDHFGRGLNLENTSDIIFFHKMPQTLTQQVVGRAQRVGRQGVLKLWHVRYENEYS